jgi:hypothetical protein
MHPSTTSRGSHHGADELDDQFEYIQPDNQPETRQDSGDNTDVTVNTVAASKAPHITPKIAPPKTVKRYNANDLPENGIWIVVTVQDGKRRETMQGRVVLTDTNRIRLREGAGLWEIPLNTILTISAGDDPAHRRR